MAIRDAAKNKAALHKARAQFALSLIPQIPTLLGVLVRRALGLSEEADYIDLETELVLTVLRATLSGNPSRPVAEAQALTLLDPGVRGRLWVVDAVADVPPERGVREALLRVIMAMADDGADCEGGGESDGDGRKVGFLKEARAWAHGHRRKGGNKGGSNRSSTDGTSSGTDSKRTSTSCRCGGSDGEKKKEKKMKKSRLRMPPVKPVEAEWTGYRAGVSRNESPPTNMSDAEKYVAMMRECRSNSNGDGTTTVLYFHGGAFYLCDPATHRQLTARLAKAVGGRVYSVRYRLAPQNPFPAALLDALVSYLTLLYPPPGSLHEAVSPKDIIFGGDSAGGNLALSLTQVILQLNRLNIKIPWFGAARTVPLPAGVTLFSPWLDMVQSMPSWQTNQRWDYLPPPDFQAKHPPRPDGVWPARPVPRQHLYVDDAFRLHPLASLHLNAKGAWDGAPPVWISCGWECLADENRYLVTRLKADGVPVQFEEFEAMPHVFAAVLPKLPAAKRCVEGWAGFVDAVTAKSMRSKGGTGDGNGNVRSKYVYVRARGRGEVERDLDRLTTRFGEREVWELAWARIREEEKVPYPRL